jgi:hypothetical protein
MNGEVLRIRDRHPDPITSNGQYLDDDFAVDDYAFPYFARHYSHDSLHWADKAARIVDFDGIADAIIPYGNPLQVSNIRVSDMRD